MYIPNDDKQNYFFYTSNSWLKAWTKLFLKQQINILYFLGQRIWECVYKTLSTRIYTVHTEQNDWLIV